MESLSLGRSRRLAKLLRSVSFLLVLALLSVVFPSEVGATGDVDVTVPSAGSDVTVSAGKVVIPLTITPVSSSWTGTLSVVMYFRQGSTTLERVYNRDLVYADVYQKTLDVTYAVPSGFGPNGIRIGTGSRYETVGNVVYVYVYLEEKPSEPPTPPPSGGGGVVGGATSDVKVSSGHAVVNPGKSQCTFYLDPTKTDDIFRDAPPTGAVLADIEEVMDVAGFTPMQASAIIPADVLAQAGAASVPSILKLGVGDVSLSPEVIRELRTALISAAGSMANLRIAVSAATQDEGSRVLSGATPPNMLNLVTPASRVITLAFLAVNPETGAETPLTVDLARFQVAFDPSAVSNPEHVGLFRIGSLIYVGGKVDLSGKTVSGNLTQFSAGQFVALEYNKTFDDIAGHWAKAEVELMASKFVVDGMTATTFEPNSPTTRAQFVTMLVRSLGLSEYRPETATFSDVAPDAWYYGYVEAAFKAGLTYGDGGKGSTFRPNDLISRQELAALMVRAMKAYGYPVQVLTAAEADELLEAFTDKSSISDWARIEAAQAYQEGIIQGRDGGQFVPLGNGTRAEAATVMSRYMKKVGIL